MKIEEWIARTEGQLDTLTKAFAALAASHQAPEEMFALLRTMATSAATTAADSPAQKAYKAGSAAAIASIGTAVELARQVATMKSQGPQH